MSATIMTTSTPTTGGVSSPWGRKSPPVAQQVVVPQQKPTDGSSKKTSQKAGLLDIMSEQLAENLDSLNAQVEEDDADAAILAQVLALSAKECEPQQVSKEPEASDLDFVLAAQMQEEEDAYLWQQERHGPKGNVTVRYFSSPIIPPEQHQRALVEGDIDDMPIASLTHYEEEDMTRSPNTKKKTPPWKVRDKSLKGQGGDGEIITKHDPEINGWKNARKLEHSVPNCGSLGGTLVPNQTFNSFHHKMKKIQHAEKGVSGRTVEEDATRSKTLDSKTRMIIHRLLDAGVLDAVNYVVRTGKEGVIFHALGPSVVPSDRPGRPPFPSKAEREQGEEWYEDGGSAGEEDEDDDYVEVTLPDAEFEVITSRSLKEEEETRSEEGDLGEIREFAVKVYKTNLTEFSNRLEYVEGDHRFASVGQLSRQNNQKIVKIWAEKELKNMTRMHRAKLPCPEPIRLDKNVLIMSFIGEDGWGAPQLADLDLGTSSSKAAKCFVQVLLLARAMWDRCKLVHADLSEFNVLYLNGKCYLVDVGQSVERTHPNADQFLRRDVFNVLTFFFNKCKKTGCGGTDEAVDKVMDWIVNGPLNLVDVDVEEDGWCKYARELGSWADYRSAVNFASLLG